MEEMTEVDFEGKKYVWDGQTWCEARTYMVPPDTVVDKLNMAFRKHELAAARSSAPAPRARSPRRASPAGRGFQPARPLTPAPPPPPPAPVEKITAYDAENAFLLETAPAVVYLEGQKFESASAALDHAREHHARLRLGMQREWEEKQRVPVMRRLLRSKFSNPPLRAALLATGEKHLSHQGDGADPFWHAPAGQGENQLGRLTMELRARLNKHYCRLNDESIVEDLKESKSDNPMVPDDALARDCCWARVTELVELYKQELPKDLLASLKARREELTTATSQT